MASASHYSTAIGHTGPLTGISNNLVRSAALGYAGFFADGSM